MFRRGKKKPAQARKTTRADGAIQVIYRYLMAGREGPAMRAETADIGVGGIFLLDDRPAPAGTPVLLTMVLPDGGTLDVRGSVRWVQSAGERSGMGIVFSHLDPPALAQLQSLCEYLGPIEPLD
jgi:hypothetical protein